MASLVIIYKVNPGWKLQRTEPFHYACTESIEVCVINQVARGEGKAFTKLCKQMQFTMSRNNHLSNPEIKKNYRLNNV